MSDAPQTPDVDEAQKKQRAAAKAPGQSDDPMIAALLRERAGYVQYGRKDRVAAVDAELKRRGHGKSEAKKAAPKKAAAKPQESRPATKAAEKRTAEKS